MTKVVGSFGGITLSLILGEMEDYGHRSIRVMLRYMTDYSGLDKEPFFDKILKNQPKLREDVMTVAEQLRQEGKSLGVQEGLEKGILQGLERGMQQGMLQGRLDEKKATALNMLKDGVNINRVAVYTGLSVNEIESLKKQA